MKIASIGFLARLPGACADNAIEFFWKNFKIFWFWLILLPNQFIVSKQKRFYLCWFILLVNLMDSHTQPKEKTSVVLLSVYHPLCPLQDGNLADDDSPPPLEPDSPLHSKFINDANKIIKTDRPNQWCERHLNSVLSSQSDQKVSTPPLLFHLKMERPENSDLKGKNEDHEERKPIKKKRKITNNPGQPSSVFTRSKKHSIKDRATQNSRKAGMWEPI